MVNGLSCRHATGNRHITHYCTLIIDNFVMYILFQHRHRHASMFCSSCIVQPKEMIFYVELYLVYIHVIITVTILMIDLRRKQMYGTNQYQEFVYW